MAVSILVGIMNMFEFLKVRLLNCQHSQILL